jgi:hypothetical protein
MLSISGRERVSRESHGLDRSGVPQIDLSATTMSLTPFIGALALVRAVGRLAGSLAASAKDCRRELIRAGRPTATEAWELPR